MQLSRIGYAVLLALALGTVGCDEALSDLTGPTPDLEPTFSSIQQQIFSNGDSSGRPACTNCHNAIGSRFNGLDLSAAVDLHRMPELICGFERHDGEFPTLYPVACAPQSWAAGAVYLLLQACLGLEVDAVRGRVTFNRAMLPESIDWLRIRSLRVGDASVDMLLERHPHDVGVTVLRRSGPVEIVALK